MFFGSLAVDADSAKIGDGKEEVGSIPEDHSNMTKFAGKFDVGFRRVSSQLRRWIEDIRKSATSEQIIHDYAFPIWNADTRIFSLFDRGRVRGVSWYERDIFLGEQYLTGVSIECLGSLDNAESRLRMNDVAPSHEKTFHWLYKDSLVQFPQWLRDEQNAIGPVFWVQGKPGSGRDPPPFPPSHVFYSADRSHREVNFDEIRHARPEDDGVAEHLGAKLLAFGWVLLPRSWIPGTKVPRRDAKRDIASDFTPI